MLVTIFGNVHRQCKHYFIIVNKRLHLVYSFFCLLHGYIYISCHIGKCRQTSKQCLNIIKKSYIGSFPDVLVIFALITILGNAHRPCEQYPNIVSNCLQHPYSFLPIIPDFLIRFTLLTILGNAHRPCKLYLNIINNFTSCLSFFS